MFGTKLIEIFVGEGQDQIIEYGQIFLVTNGVSYWLLALLFIFRSALQGLGKSFVPTLAGAMELIMRIAAAIFLVDLWGYFGACLANPMAWLGSVIPLSIAFFIIRRNMQKFLEREEGHT